MECDYVYNCNVESVRIMALLMQWHKNSQMSHVLVGF